MTIHHFRPTAWNAAYSASKAALHNFTEAIYQECKPFSIKVTIVVPGSVKSNIADKNGDKGSPRELTAPYSTGCIEKYSLLSEMDTKL